MSKFHISKNVDELSVAKARVTRRRNKTDRIGKKINEIFEKQISLN